MSHAIHIENLTRLFGNFTVVEKISFNFSQGDIFGLLDPNGVRKNTKETAGVKLQIGRGGYNG